MIAGLLDALTWALLLTLALRQVFFGWRRRWPCGLRWLAIAALYAAVDLASRALSPDGDALLALAATVLGAPAGLFGGVSLSLAVAVCALDRHDGVAPFAPGERLWLPRLITITALLFYPPALGLGPVDPYAWGYGGAAALPLLVGALALAAWLGGWRTSALALAAALAAWRMHLLDSANLWDYLLDPLLALGAIGSLGSRLRRRETAGHAHASTLQG
ncbi:MAG: hypothetical protein LBP86_10225 [Azoarcus sp.]|jgi:hypothetical protein|nr:hypothetical protein [Azoarcus sp.]